MGSILSGDGFPSFSHFFIAILFAFACFAARFLLDRFVFRGLATWLLRNGATKKRMNKATIAKIEKCSESMWKFVYYTTLEFCVLKAAYDKPWFLDNRQYFTGWPNQELTLDVSLIYMCQCGFYVYSIAALLFWETRRKDFAVMMSHHVVTVILISYSYVMRLFRPGLVILALHDASDVFMEAAKMCKYSEREFGASLFFGLFAISWLVLRLIYFPFWVIRSTSIYLVDALTLPKPSHIAIYYICNTFLLTLLVFHIYWWVLICAMIKRQLKNKGQVGEDIRSDSEDED